MSSFGDFEIELRCDLSGVCLVCAALLMYLAINVTVTYFLEFRLR